jgi:hypothetical protein
VPSTAMDWSDMSGSSTLSPHRMVEVTSSRQLEPAAREKNAASSSRSATYPVREDQQAARPRMAPSGFSASEARRDLPRGADPPRRSEERATPPRPLFYGSDRPDSDPL